MIRERFETVAMLQNGRRGESGFLSLTDIQYRPFMKSYRIKGRVVMFETEGSDSRIYVYESDVLYSSSVPGYSGKGVHFQINFNCDLNQVIHILKNPKNALEFWFTWMQTTNFQQPNLPASSLKTAPVFAPKFTSQITLSL
jgi:hypothetical protein